MTVARVVATVVATAHHPAYDGRTLLVVQPIDEHGRDAGDSHMAVDTVQAGTGDTVLVVREGGAVRPRGRGQVAPRRAPVPPLAFARGVPRWPTGRSADGGLDRVPLPFGTGALWMCGKHRVGPDPEAVLRSIR